MIASIILVLYFLQIISIGTAIACLYVTALLLFLAEIGVTSLGLLALNALLSLYAGYALQSGDTMILGVDVGWSFLFGVAFIEFAVLFFVYLLWQKQKRHQATTGVEAMIDQSAVVVNWNGTTGKVSFEGEVWQAKSADVLDLNPQDTIKIHGVEKLYLIVGA